MLPAAPRIVFFGRPGSGKTALIDLFVRQAASAADATPVELTPASSTQTSLRRELVPHELLVANPEFPGGTFILIDCDGQAAGELLDHANRRIRGAARGALDDAVRRADALVLVVDAAADQTVIDQTFRSFGQFLDALEEGRTFGREVGGLPIFLTLTMCDKLAKPGDTPTDWLDRIAERERILREQFEDYFGDEVAHEDPSLFLAFGSIDLHLMATARSTPDGAMFEAYADPDGAFRVAELVWQTLSAARAFRKRVVIARKRLRWLVTGVTLFVGLILVGLVVLSVSGGFSSTDQLAERVRAYQRDTTPAAERLADRNFARNRKELSDIISSAGFNGLPADLRKFVLDRYAEFNAYRDYRNLFRPPRLGPAEIQTTEQAKELETALQTELAPPPEYQSAWAETEAVRLRAKWQADVVLVRDAERQLHEGFRDVIDRGNRLLGVTSMPDSSWRSQVNQLFVGEALSPFLPAAEVEVWAAVAGAPVVFGRSPYLASQEFPQSLAVPIVRGQKLTYSSAFGFRSVEQAQTDWLTTRTRLKDLRNLTDALGLTANGAIAVLDLPEPIGDVPRDLAGQRLAALQALFGNLNHPEWELANFPDPVRHSVGTRLRAAFDTGARHVRKYILVAHGPGPESIESWDRVAKLLQQDPDLKDWGRLLGLLRRWNESRPSLDPVQELAEFLARGPAELHFGRVMVTIPNRPLDRISLPPGERFIVTVTPADGSPISYAFRQDVSRDEPGEMTFTFVPDGHPGTIPYRPTSQVTASLLYRAGGQDQRLSWSAERSAVYHLDALARSPRVEKVAPLAVPEPAPGVRLSVAPPMGLPSVPVLLWHMRR